MTTAQAVLLSVTFVLILGSALAAQFRRLPRAGARRAPLPTPA